MKSYLYWSFLGFFSSFISLNAQHQNIDSTYANSYYKGRMEVFQSLPETKNAVVFLGNSITERGHWNELLQDMVVMNRGIGGDNTFGVRARLDDILAQNPKKAFILIGINDIGRGLPIEVITENYRRILKRFKEETTTKVYVQSVLPVNDKILTADYLKNKKDLVRQLNTNLKELASQFGVEYIDLYNQIFSDGEGNLKSYQTIDGIHLKPAAYVEWVNYLKEKKYL